MRKKHETAPDEDERDDERKSKDEGPLVLQEVARPGPRRCQRNPVLVVPALSERGVPRDLRVELGRGGGRRLALVCLGEAIGAVLDELQDAVRVALDEGPVQSREALLVGVLHACAPSEEDIDTLVVALVRGPHEGSVAVGVEDVDGYALVEEQDDEEDVSVEGRGMEGVVALRIGYERVGAVLEEEVNGVVVAALGSPLKRRRDRLAALSVDLGAVLDEELAHGVLVVDGGPLRESYMLAMIEDRVVRRRVGTTYM